MERYEITLLIHLLETFSRNHSFRNHLFSRNKRVESHHFHSESLCLFSNQTADISICLDADFLALDFHSCARCELIA